jgi:transcription elongation factor GreA
LQGVSPQAADAFFLFARVNSIEAPHSRIRRPAAAQTERPGEFARMEMQPISREGYDKLREEIRRLEDDEMPRIAAQIAAARAEGDLSENAEYHGQREAQGLLQAKINQLKSKLGNCYIADKSSMPKGVVAFGATVTIKDLSDGSLEKYELVGPGEENYDGEVMKILTSSPIAQGLLGKKVGDSAEVTIPRGVLRMKIVEIADA